MRLQCKSIKMYRFDFPADRGEEIGRGDQVGDMIIQSEWMILIFRWGSGDGSSGFTRCRVFIKGVAGLMRIDGYFITSGFH